MNERDGAQWSLIVFSCTKVDWHGSHDAVENILKFDRTALTSPYNSVSSPCLFLTSSHSKAFEPLLSGPGPKYTLRSSIQ